MAGQLGEFEHTGNLAENWEYVVATYSRIKHASLPFTRGHSGSSTRAIGCGYFQAGGTSNGSVKGGLWGTLANGSKTTDVSFSDMTMDSWTKIGDLTNPINILCAMLVLRGWANRAFPGAAALKWYLSKGFVSVVDMEE